MCGPLACLLGPVRGERADATTVNATSQLSRVTGYTLLGAVAGAIGGVPATFLAGAMARVFPWLLVVFFVMVAVRLDHRLARPAGISRMALRVPAPLRGE